MTWGEYRRRIEAHIEAAPNKTTATILVPVEYLVASLDRVDALEESRAAAISIAREQGRQKAKAWGLLRDEGGGDV